MTVRVERVRKTEGDVIAYLERNEAQNALDIWNLLHEDNRYELNVCRVGDEVKAHLSIYDSPEAKYVALGGEVKAVDALLHLVPSRAVLTASPDLGELVASRLRCDAVYPNDLMMVERGEEKLRSPELATTLSREHDVEYSSFGSSFNVPSVPLEWIRERLDRDIIFGAFSDGKLVSVASLAAWLPRVAMLMGVETKREFRRKGFGGIAVSAAVQEALKRSQSCGLFVRSDNNEAIGLYRTLGFHKFGEQLWVDVGTGLVP